MRFESAALALAALVTAGTARAEPPTARLLYARGDGAETCPEAGALRDAVTMRLGYDPFRTSAATTVEASVARDARGLRANVRIYDATGTRTGEREIDAKGDDCASVAAAMALTISILVDPHGVGRTTMVAPPPVEPSPAGPLDTADVHDSPFEHAPPPPPPAPRERIVVRAGLAGLVSIGAAPSVASGAAVLVGIARGPWAVDLEGRVDLPASSAEADGSAVRSSLRAGSLVPCYVPGIFRACLHGLFGALRGEGIGVSGRDNDQTFYAAAGLRAELDPPIGSGFVLRTYADALAPVVRTTLRAVDRDAVWTTPPWLVSVGLGLARDF